MCVLPYVLVVPVQGLVAYTRLSVVDLEADQEQLPKVGLTREGRGEPPGSVDLCTPVVSCPALQEQLPRVGLRWGRVGCPWACRSGCTAAAAFFTALMSARCIAWADTCLSPAV